MNNLTVYLLEDFFINTLSLTGDILSLSNYAQGNSLFTKLYTCNIFHLRKGMIVNVDCIEYTVVSVNHSENSFTLETDLSEASSFSIANPFYLFGTPINANVELSNTDASIKYPFVWLKELIREKIFSDYAGFDREAQIELFFLDEMNKEDWHTKEFYNERLIGLNKLVNEVIRQLKKDISNFYLTETEFDVINHGDFGLLIQPMRGHIKSLFSDNLSAVQLSFTLTIKKGCKCLCCNNDTNSNYMFRSIEFETFAGETTKVLTVTDEFPAKKLPFIFQLFEVQNTGVLTLQVVGEGLSAYPSEEGGIPDTSTPLVGIKCDVNEETNTFSFTGLQSEKDYKINIIQQQP